MVFLTLLALWFTLDPGGTETGFRQITARMRGMISGEAITAVVFWLAPLALALATLTKILPAFVLAVLFWRWQWRQLAVWGGVVLGLLALAALSAGWGLSGPLDGTGLFGALRIYAAKWNFNSGLFHWLEVNLLPAWGVVEPTRWAKRVAGGLMLASLAGVWLIARHRQSPRADLRLLAWPFIAYILLTPTVHPWYLLILLAFVPFLPPAQSESPWRWLAPLPWLYLSAAVALSYVTYLNPLDLREFEWVRKSEWWPTLALLALWLSTRLRKFVPIF
jgi:hypothetical protein